MTKEERRKALADDYVGSLNKVFRNLIDSHPGYDFEFTMSLCDFGKKIGTITFKKVGTSLKYHTETEYDSEIDEVMLVARNQDKIYDTLEQVFERNEFEEDVWCKELQHYTELLNDFE